MIDTLSDEAKAIAGFLFGLGTTELNFSMIENRPTQTMQAALDELVAAKVITVHELNGAGGKSYRPAADMGPYRKWAAKNTNNPKTKFRMWEPIR